VTSAAAERLQISEEPQRATFLELFFDLVFVFALTRLGQGLIGRLAWSNAFQTLLMVLAVWWIWSLTAGITDRFRQGSEIQLLVIATMFGSLVMAAAIPDAFGGRGLVFAGAYVTIQVGRSLVLLLVTRRHKLQRTAVRLLFWSGVSAVPWITGALFPDGLLRGGWWTIAVAGDYTAGILRYPTPKLGRAPIPEWPIVAEHLSERYRQFFTIALGDSILVIGLAYSAGSFAADRTAALLVSFVATLLLWRIYIYRSGELLAAAITASTNPARVGLPAAYAHLVMVAGTVVIAVGDELVIAHPLGNTQLAWVAVILGGPALFLTGRAMLEYAVFARVSRNRPIGLLVLAAMAPAVLLLPPLLAATAAALALAAIAILDAARAREHPLEPPSPPA
jgi:low temperature requirement protein LtrA